MSTPPNTDRLAFRNWRDDDVDRFHEICSDPRVMQHVGDGRAWSRDRAAEFIEAAQRTLREHGYCQWPVVQEADGTLIGYCGFANSDGTPEIGWRLAPEYWGQGLATEAAKAVLRYGIETLGFERVIATVQADNTASIRVIEKLAMVLVKRFVRDGRKIVLYSTFANICES